MQNKYNTVKERISEDVYTITYTAKERKCDICVSVKKSTDITIVKYPIIDKCMGRLIMTKRVCNECYGDVMEILNNLKYN
jgi:hypothetical protein